MNSTPNYGLKLEVCGADSIDRELKRIEDKLDCKLAGKASKCEFEKHLMDPHAHQELFDKKVDKKEGCRLICEGELQEIHDALEDRYTQDEVDELLSNKANRTIPEMYELPLAEGLEPREMCYYYKHENNETHVHGDIVANDRTLVVGSLLATMPVGFRPANEHAVSATYVSKDLGYCPGMASIFPSGEVIASLISPDDVEYVRFHTDYLATQ